ncbi:GNAT family N-acetyltransferase [Antarcticirhabdus aurantiaca]|uniref:GNAT family N-acetyltransferase n=1 Tax=Antarcticirhabdus aurantiaca TaxID=2606717 RepID=A0ACD4NL69_9HYPH|nr:GNAT family N-acetyltransferase [Antarcticirhabdus aurantiaca]WAJ27365.1 GNAT family N-acetyltransferase [Jeongeuplla avenae]
MIETERLLLRAPIPEDFEPIAAMSADAAVSRFVGGRPATREESWHRLLRHAGHWTLFGYGLFSVVEKATGNFAGYAGLAFFERGFGPRFDGDPEAAWAFAPAAQNKGFATEAAHAAHAALDARLGPRRTVCIIDPENAASLNVAAKLGYVRFGEVFYRDKTVWMLERVPAALRTAPAAP